MRVLFLLPPCPPFSYSDIDREIKASHHDIKVRRIDRHFGLANLFSPRTVC